VNKNPTDATVYRYLFIAKLLYMFRVSQHQSSGVLKTVPAASGTGHTTCTATPLQSGLIGTQSILCYITYRTLSLRNHRNRVIEILYIYVCIYFQTFVKECQYTVLINYGRRQNILAMHGHMNVFFLLGLGFCLRAQLNSQNSQY